MSEMNGGVDVSQAEKEKSFQAFKDRLQVWVWIGNLVLVLVGIVSFCSQFASFRSQRELTILQIQHMYANEQPAAQARADQEQSRAHQDLEFRKQWHADTLKAAG